MPKKVAICDHTIEHYVESMKDVLGNRGHQVEHYYSRNPRDVYDKLVQLDPDVIIMDLHREPEDNEKEPTEWWGVQILRLIKSSSELNETRIMVGTKYPREDLKNYIKELGVADDCWFNPLITQPKKVLEMVEK